MVTDVVRRLDAWARIGGRWLWRMVQAGARRFVRLPLAVRLSAAAVVVALAFVAVVLPLFATGGPPRAELAGEFPQRVASVGTAVRMDLAVDNTGDSIIFPLCITLTGSDVRLLSADFGGVETVHASSNQVCGGQLTGQETVSVQLVLSVQRPGTAAVELLPQQGSTVIGPPLRGTVSGG